ncbi:MAG: putative transposase [Candidatus Dormiibacterota bacterium]
MLGRNYCVVRDGGQVGVFVGSTPIQVFEADDRAAKAATLAMLVRVGAASKVEIADAFGVHRNTVARLSERLRQGGMAAVVPAKPGPKGPHKVTDEVRRVIFENSGLNAMRVSRLVAEKTGVELTGSRVWQLRRDAARRQVELSLEPEPKAEVAEVVEDEAAATPQSEINAGAELMASSLEPPVMVPEQSRGRYLGAALYYPALQALGLLEAARDCFRLPNSELFGVRAITLTLFYLNLFGKTTVEAAKHLRRWEFGPLVGSGRAPAVKTLRRKLAELVAQAQGSRFGEILSRRWVEQGLIATAYLYVDGHMKLYTGKRKLAEIWNSQRRMPLPGVLNYFVNDQQARPLLFIPEEANATLAKSMPRIIEAIREVLGNRPFTVIFDRGGYDGKLFNWLRGEKIDFITYQRGNPRLKPELFKRRECRFEGRRVRMQLAEDKVRVGQSGVLRRIVFRAPADAHQTPILTSLGPELGAARVASLMFARWRQENFFRYMREHHGLDQLLGYAYAEADGTRLVANPERKTIDRQLKALRQELSALQAKLGQAVLDEPRDGGRSAHGLKIAQKGAVSKLRLLEAQIADLVASRRVLPEKVSVASIEKREVMRLEQKAIIDRIKITAYNAEEWLLDRLIVHYPKPHEIRGLLRSFAQLSGEISSAGGGVLVTLDPPDTPHHRRALRGLCQDLNRIGAVFPGTDLRVTYAVAVHHSELAA